MPGTIRSLDRRAFLRAAAIAGGAGALWAAGWPLQAAQRYPLQPRPRFAGNPFTLGIASGYPTPDGMVLWTRLAPTPAAPGGGMRPEIVPVHWTLAADESMRNVVASGTAYADPDYAHAVHVETAGLRPDRWYWYRFRSGSAQSPVGRTRTAPPANREAARVRFAVASCQQFEQGWYGAYAHMLRDELDFVLFLGDYIYETSWGSQHVRSHGAPETVSLDDYRARHALYKTDPDLQAAHAAVPWLATWDDHEVGNDYANDRSENADDPAWFLARRAAAYRAYYEHMPLPRRMLPAGPHMRIHTRAAFGRLAGIHLLDGRQYRSPQACPRIGRGGSNVVDVEQCGALGDAGRNLLGEQQSAWLGAGLAASRAKWNLIAQQTLMARLDQKPGPGRSAWTDGWDGYPQSRRRLLEFIAEHKVANPVVLGGDVHMFYVSDLKPDFDDDRSPVVASEFVTTSISSQAPSQASRDRLLPDNPHLKLAETRHRGYTRVELTPQRMAVDLRGMANVATRDAACATIGSWVVEDGQPGPQRG